MGLALCCCPASDRFPADTETRAGRAVAHSVLEGGGWSRKRGEEASSQSTAGSRMDSGPRSTDSPEARLSSSGWGCFWASVPAFPCLPWVQPLCRQRDQLARGHGQGADCTCWLQVLCEHVPLKTRIVVILYKWHWGRMLVVHPLSTFLCGNRRSLCHFQVQPGTRVAPIQAFSAAHPDGLRLRRVTAVLQGTPVCPTCCGPELRGRRRSGSTGSRPPWIFFSRLTPGGSGPRGLAPCPAGPEQTLGSRHRPSRLFRPCGYSCLPAVSPVQAHREGSLFPLICLRCGGVPLLPDDSVPLEAWLLVEHLGVGVSPAVTPRLSAPVQVTQGRAS